MKGLLVAILISGFSANAAPVPTDAKARACAWVHVIEGLGQHFFRPLVELELLPRAEDGDETFVADKMGSRIADCKNPAGETTEDWLNKTCTRSEFVRDRIAAAERGSNIQISDRVWTAISMEYFKSSGDEFASFKADAAGREFCKPYIPNSP